MGNLNLGQYETAVLGALDGLRANHPLVVANEHTRCINDAANDLIRWFPNHFPEHKKKRTWSTGPTTVGENQIALPENLNVLERVVHSGGETITDGDWTAVRERYMAPFTTETIGLLDKSTSRTGYPTLWDRKGVNLIYFPTTQTGFTTTFRFYGSSGEIRLTASGDTFRMNRDFDQVIILLAASKMAMLVGYLDRSIALETAARRIMTSGQSVVGRELAAKGYGVTSALCPD